MKLQKHLGLVLSLLLSIQCFGQLNSIQLEEVQGSYYDSDNNLIVPKYNLKYTSDAYLYYKDNLIFEEFVEGSKFENVLYQIYANRYLVISAYIPSIKATTPEFIFKKDVIVMDTKLFDKLYYFNLKGSIIVNIYRSEEYGIGVNTVESKNLKRFMPLKNR